MSGDDTAVLRVAGRPVGRYVTRPELPARLSPRPYLHPVTTLAGTAVTELSPADHAHHLGVGVAVPDVEGHNFWGGRTYVRDRGPTELDNHGSQRHTGFQLRDPDGFVAELRWVAAGAELLRERRTVAATELTGTAWALDFTFSLTNVTPGTLTIGSPATNGRPGAAYGGFFWRAAKEAGAPDVFTPDAEGEAEVHGGRADWLALAGSTWTLVFAGATEATRRDPWFVRTAEYPGVGSSLASGQRLAVPAGDTVVRRIVTVVADGRLDRAAAAALVRKAVSA
ncbi:PmoA family protein [Streptomyces sp. NPDC085946]|uniref:PmoA family protein n=1 Tax=Streptomyces sp. NPDC085946 TaxID=3365744 RepID=UPI0037D06D70